MTILFTSAGRRVELLRAFRRSFEILGIPGRLVALDIDPLAPALRVADKGYIVPELRSPEYISTLCRIVKEEQVSLIIPLIDSDISLLAQNRELLEATGAEVAVVDERAAVLTRDKWHTTRFFEGLGLSTPASWLPDDPALSNTEYPLFIKPRRGSGSKHTYRVNSSLELDFFTRYVPEPIVQELLPGPEITTDVVCGLDGTLLGVVNRQRIAVRSGEVVKGVTIRDPRIVEACTKIAAVLPARGPTTVQCIMRDDVPHFTEINARFGGGVPLGIAAGVDAPTLLLAHTFGLPFAGDPIGEYTTGLYLSRFDDSFFLTEEQREQVADNEL